MGRGSRGYFPFPPLEIIGMVEGLLLGDGEGEKV